MDAYIYDADIYCETCGAVIRARIDAEGHAPADPDDESSYDSGEYPKGPYPDGGGEADCPQHCGNCGTFLENPLTTEGKAYVRRLSSERPTETTLMWWAHYDLARPCEWCGQTLGPADDKFCPECIEDGGV